MSADDEKALEQKRDEIIAVHEQRRQQATDERKALIREIFALTKITGAWTRLPGQSEVNEDDFQQYLAGFPMTADSVTPFGAYNAASLPSEEFLLGPSKTARNRTGSMIIPSVKIHPYSEDEQDDEDAMDVDPETKFSSSYPVKIHWSKASREDPRANRPALFASNFASALPPPPLRLLPDDFNRPTQFSLRAVKKERANDKENQSPQAIDFNRWQATLIHNPAYKLVRKASKCLTTKDWNTAIQELVLFRAFERVDELKTSNMWSFRQPARQVNQLVKDHWSYLLDEAIWMQADFREERKWKMALAAELAEAVMEWHRATPLKRMQLQGFYVAPSFPEDPEPIERGVPPPETEEEAPQPDEPMQGEESNEETEVQAVIEDADGAAMDIEESKATTAASTSQSEPTFTMKIEETEEADLGKMQTQSDGKEEAPVPPDEKTNPVMYTVPEDVKAPVEAGIDAFAMREPIANLDKDALWVDPIELQDVIQPASAEDTAIISDLKSVTQHAAAKFDWDEVFPKPRVYNIAAPPDVPKGIILSRKDEVQTPSIPISRFTAPQPLLLGALQPSVTLQNGEWGNFNRKPVSQEEGQRPKPDPLTSGQYAETWEEAKFNRREFTERPKNPISAATTMKITQQSTTSRSPSWYPADDEYLREIAPELTFNWRLVADTFNFQRHSGAMDIRTAMHCYVRYSILLDEDRAVIEADNSMTMQDFDISMKSIDKRQPTTPVTPFRRVKAAEEFAPTAGPSDIDPRFMRHKFVHRAIKKLMKRRDDEAKARDIPHRPTVPHQSHESIMKAKYLSPQELSKAKREQEEKRLQDLQKRRTFELRQAQDARMRAMHAQGQPILPPQMANGMPGQMVVMNGNPQMGGPGVPVAMRMAPAGGVPNISQQANVNMMAAVQRGPNGDLTQNMQSAMILLQQQQQQQQQQQNQQRMAAAMANGASPRPQSAASILQQGAMGNQQAHAAMLARHHAAMQDPAARAQMQQQQANALAAQMAHAQQFSQMGGMPVDPMALLRQQQLQAHQAQAARAAAQQMAAGAAMQQQHQQQTQQQPNST